MKLTKKILAISALGVSIAAFITFIAVQSQEPQVSQAYTVLSPEIISMDSRRMASATPIPGYETAELFVSEEQVADFPFTSVGGYWEEIAPEGTNVQALARFKVDDEWTEWVELDEEVEYEGEESSTKFAMASSKEAEAFQYKFLLYGNGETTPIIKNAEWTFIDGGARITTTSTPKPQYSSNSFVSSATYMTLTSNQKTVVSRSGWGANEDYRYLENNDNTAVLVDYADSYYETYAEELKYSRVVEEDENGDVYKWPLQYPQNVSKFVIHHTATTSNLEDPEQAIRDIYYYHAMTRGWGDIGYNYLIAPDGSVYEGRYGGEGVVGAHAGKANTGSIGIAILGDYEQNVVPEKVVSSLANLISNKAKIHNIDPEGKSMFRGENLPNIIGHKDVMSTACPGAYLYEKLPIIRELASEMLTPDKEKFVKDYDYIDESDIHYVEMGPDEIKTITIEMENIGKVDWNADTYIVVNEDPDFDGVVSFPSEEGYVLAMMEEDKVEPGETATFKFTVKGGSKGDTVYMNIAPLVNGYKKVSEYIVLPITVQSSSYKYKFISQDFPETLEAGESFEATVKLKNTGNITWRQTGKNTVVLGTDHERDRKTSFTSPSSSRIGYLVDEEVAPGETGTFKLTLKAPSTAGYYKEYFTPVVEGVTWMSDSGMYFETTVYGDGYSGELVSQSTLSEWKQGKSYIIWVKLRNLGRETWDKKDITLDSVKERDLEITNVKLSAEEVEPGDTAKIQFTVTVDPNEDLETKRLILLPKVDGKKTLSKPIYFYYTVEDNSLSVVPKIDSDSNLSEEEKDIRVKLSFSGSPEIVSDDDFDIYAGSEKLESTDRVKIYLINSKYRVETDDELYTSTEPVRIVPGEDVLEIENYDHQPAWNPDLNDNMYRGVLEMQDVDGELAVINELPLEDYLKGLGEVSNDEKYEKIKAIMVAARTYARYYITEAEKFPGKPYNLDDNPDVSQKYLGYGLELRAPNVAQAVEETRGEVVTYDGEIVKTPYFNQSDGTQTKSAKAVWNWDAPYLLSVNDSYCDGDVFLGHGVGLSGCGAHGMAERGFSYVQILQHYYTNTKITDLY